jgi:hypothetical protein
MAEANVLPLSKTRPDLPPTLLGLFDRALAANPAARDLTAHDVVDALRGAFDLEVGAAALLKLLARWREPLAKSMTPWERRASMYDGVVASSDVEDGALALAMPDDRPSSDAIVGADAPDEPWAKEGLSHAETALDPTRADVSVSRLGAAAETAFDVPLPAERMTMPNIPTYSPSFGPPAPRTKRPWFSGRVAAVGFIVVFAGLVVGAVVLLRWLAG